jgi:hypothetical protein
VSQPVRVPRPGVGRVIGEQIRVSSQLDAECGQGGPDPAQVARDQRAGVWVDGEPAVLVGLGVLEDALAAADDVVEGDVRRSAVQIDVADLQAAQLIEPSAQAATGTWTTWRRNLQVPQRPRPPPQRGCCRSVSSRETAIAAVIQSANERVAFLAKEGAERCLRAASRLGR